MGAIPFGLFYGSVDSTVLFLMVAAEYITWTGDLDLYRELKPNFEAAWEWIDKYGKIDGSGYIQYKAHTPPRKCQRSAHGRPVFNQGWKDSANAVGYSDGTMCTDHPVALAERFGLRALRSWGKLYAAMPGIRGRGTRSRRASHAGRELKEQFNREFWMPDKGYYAMALDGHHRQVDTITSNPGHCLWTRVIDEEHAEDTANVLLSNHMSSGWGIRSMSNIEKAYNPLSYHNGSVWPFENTLIGAGLKRYGCVDESNDVFHTMLDAAWHFEYARWPEVYAGVTRELLDVWRCNRIHQDLKHGRQALFSYGSKHGWACLRVRSASTSTWRLAFRRSSTG